MKKFQLCQILLFLMVFMGACTQDNHAKKTPDPIFNHLTEVLKQMIQKASPKDVIQNYFTSILIVVKH